MYKNDGSRKLSYRQRVKKTKRLVYLKEYRSEEHARLHRKVWLEAHPAYHATWRKNHPEYFRENCRKWRSQNPDYARNYSREWRSRHPEYYKKYRKRNRRRLKKYSRNYKRKVRTKVFLNSLQNAKPTQRKKMSVKEVIS